jgi:lambda family phage portal protein
MNDARSVSRPAYAAAGDGRRLRYFPAVSFGPNSALSKNASIVARSREAHRADPWAVALTAKSVANGVGTGIEARPIWGNKAQKSAQKKLWKRWCKRCDADGVLIFAGIQALVWREWKEAGECFVRLRTRREEDGLPVPLQLQVIEAEQCPSHYHGTASNGNAIRYGIEFDKIGRRRAYWMYRTHPGDPDQSGSTGLNDLVRVPAEQVLHIYQPLRAGQMRGVAASAASLVMMLNLQLLSDAKLENYKLANLYSLFFVSDAQAGQQLGGESPVDDIETDEDENGPIAGLEPGTAQVLPPGVKPEFSDPPTPGSDYAEYLRGLLMAIAASHGVPYEVLTGDLRDVSDRALRLILNEFRRTIEMEQWLTLIPLLCDGVRGVWYDMAVLAGKLSIPGYADIRDDVIETVWVPQGWPYSHPVQDVDADIKAIRAGLASRSGTNMSNGEDGEAIDAEQVEDNSRADDLGLTYDSDSRIPKAAVSGAPKRNGATDEVEAA